jgi:hypothetical protein
MGGPQKYKIMRETKHFHQHAEENYLDKEKHI